MNKDLKALQMIGRLNRPAHISEIIDIMKLNGLPMETENTDPLPLRAEPEVFKAKVPESEWERIKNIPIPDFLKEEKKIWDEGIGYALRGALLGASISKEVEDTTYEEIKPLELPKPE